MNFPSFLRHFRERWLRTHTSSRRDRPRRRARPEFARRPNLEGLEDRTLLSVLPAPRVLDRSQLLTGPQDSSPVMAVHPLQPRKMVMAWVTNPNPGPQPLQVVGAFTANGGNTWQLIPSCELPVAPCIPTNLGDPTPNPPPPPGIFPNAVEPGVAFDRFDNVYFVWAQRRTDNAAGVVVMYRFNFAGNTPMLAAYPAGTPDRTPDGGKILYQWAHQAPANNLSDPAFNPTIVIDTNNPSFTDPQTDRVQGSPYSVVENPSVSGEFNSTIYVAWNNRHQTGAGSANQGGTIRLTTSADGGRQFSTPVRASTGVGTHTLPTMTVSQGRSDNRVRGGQLNLAWAQAGVANSQVVFRSSLGGGVGYVFEDRTGGTILDACAALPPATAHRPRFTEYVLNPMVPLGFTATDVDIRVSIDHLTMEDVRIEIDRVTDPRAGQCLDVDPSGPALLQNRLNRNGQAGTPPAGITGPHLGMLRDRPNLVDVGTTFDDQAARFINDPAALNSRHASHFRPEAPEMLTRFNLPASQINISPFVLRIWDTRNSGPNIAQRLVRWSIRFTGGVNLGSQAVVALDGIGAEGPGFPPPVTLPANWPHSGPWQTQRELARMPFSPDWGVAPAPALASDNTLGSFSPYQGRLYLAYTAAATPASPDVFLLTSDDGGASWISRGRVNNDSLADGFSEGNRAQFSPAVGVDSSTGTLVLSWYDGRHDAGRTRVARFLTTSINGGRTFSEQVFANSAAAPVDAITRQATILGPVPENMGPLNPSRNQVFGYGNIQAMGIFEGRAILAWTGNRNVVGNSNIQIARAAITVGGRIVESTMGPVRRTATNSEYQVQRLVDGQLIIYNNTFNANGVRQLNGFVVTFDRFMDSSTFTPDDVFLMFRGPSTPIGLPGERIAVTSITPLFDERFATEDPNFASWITPVPPPLTALRRQQEWCYATGDPTREPHCGAKKFLVSFAPQSRVGTYSYSVGPGIRDRIRGSAYVIPNPTERPFNATNVPLRVPPSGTGGTGDPALDITLSSLNITNTPANHVVSSVQVCLGSWEQPILTEPFRCTATGGGLEHTYVSDLVITLISPTGVRVLLANQRGGGGQNYVAVNFMDGASPIAGWSPPQTGSFAPEEALAAFQLQDPLGTWQLEINDVAPQDTGFLRSWGIKFFTGLLQGTFRDGNWMDQNSDGQRVELEINLSPTDAFSNPRPLGGVPFTAPYDLTTLPLIIPGPFVFTSNIPNRPSTQDNLLTDAANNAIDVVFDRAIDPASFTPAQVLRIQSDIATLAVAPIVLQLDARSFRIIFPTQTLSATYTFTLGSGIRSVTGEQLDSNHNAGLFTLRGFDPAGTNETRTYNSTAAPVTLDPSKTVSMPLDVPNVPLDTFVLQGLALRLDINYPSNEVHNLVGTLVHPDGTRVLLFDRLRQGSDFQAAFPDTRLDDTIDPPRTTAITTAPAPYFGTYNPQLPLSVLRDKLSTGAWRLEIQNKSETVSGVINGWGVDLLKNIPGTGLGEPVADLGTASFRLWTWDGRNPISRTQFQPMGPASVTEQSASGPITRSNRIAGIVVDPSDPSGNTVYVAGASGGLWKTSNFLTSDPLGPTYIPLTDFGPALGLNVGNVAVMGRNNDPRQSVIFLATGEGDAQGFLGGYFGTSRGVGFIRSMDGGANWLLLDSTNNFDGQDNPLPINSPLRDKRFVGTSAFKVLVDPRLSPENEVVIYAALSGPNGGVYRSVTSGRSWQLMRAGQATDIIFDENSAVVDAFGRPGNLQVLYAGFRGEGVFISPDRGTVWNRLDGVTGNPNILSAALGTSAPVQRPASPLQPRNPEEDVPTGSDNRPSTTTVNSPNGLNGRILLAKPSLTGNPLQDKLYEGWVYAAVVAPGGHLAGLYQTKDTGANWTRIRTASATDFRLVINGIQRCGNVPAQSIAPTNDGAVWDNIPNCPPHVADYGNLTDNDQGNYDVSLAVDPNNPNVIYFGGLGMIRVDTTGMSDAHSYFLPNDRNEGTRAAPQGRLRCLPYGPPPPPPMVVSEAILAQRIPEVPNQCAITNPTVPYWPEQTPFLNMLQDPNNPFAVNTTFTVGNLLAWNNTGVGTRWIPWNLPMQQDPLAAPAVDHHRITTFRDQATGRTRLIFGTDQGVYTAVDDGKGGYVRSIGGVPDITVQGGNVNVPFGSRNGNLQIAQMYAGAAQPSVAAAQIASRIRGQFYSVLQDAGSPASLAGILDPTSPQYGNNRWVPPAFGDGTDVATDQQGFGTVYHTLWPCCGGGPRDFFKVDYVSRVTGLYQVPNNDPQWPDGPSFRFAVNPIDSRQIVISSGAGRVFVTYDQGQRWLVIGNPVNLDSTNAQALAWGAPRPGDPFGSRNNFIYAGTRGGNIFVTFTGGGDQGNDWRRISTGLDGSRVMAIVTNPNRGSREAYAVTQRGVYHMADSGAPTPTWTSITGNLFALTHQLFQNPNQVDTLLRDLSSIVADWRYVLPDDPSLDRPPTADPALTHPVLYVAGEAGVFRSVNHGQTWTHFPDTSLDNAPRAGGYLPNFQGTDLDLSLGRINQTDGMPEMARAGTDMLFVSSFGRSAFGIRLAPLIFPQTVRLSPTLPNDGPGNVGSDRGLSNTDRITNVIRPVFEGQTEASQARAGGNRVRIFLFDVTNQANRRLVGTAEADEFGRFAVQVDAGVYRSDGSTDGVKQLEMYAEDSSDVRGNTATFSFELRSGQPPLPGVPDLAAFSDSGLANDDNYTNVQTPVFVGGGGVLGMAVRIFANGQLVGQGLVDGNGNYAVQTSPLPDGNYTITARQVDLAGNISPFTAPLQPLLTIDTVAPAAPPFTLDAGSDSGFSNTDRITNVNRPTFTGTGEALAQVALLFNNQVVGSGAVGPTGSFAVQPSLAAFDGTYSVTVQLVDRAGNVGPVTPPMQPALTIDTVAPRTPSVPQLSPASRTGQGNTTRFSTPTFIGTGESNIFMQILANGNVVGQGLVDAIGNYAITTSPLADGTYTVTGRLLDLAGNFSAQSAALQPPLEVKTSVGQGQGRPTLGLRADYILGGTGPNDVITPFIPQVYEGTAPAGATVRILNGTTVVDTFVQGSGNLWSRTISLLDGRYVLVAEVTDGAGNVARSDVLTVTVNRNALDADRRFIRALYVDGLGRTGTVAEWDNWVPHLRVPNGRALVANAIERSREARTVLVKTWYPKYLGRQAGGNEEQAMVTALTQGFTEEQVLGVVFGSPEYFNRSPLVAGFAGAATNETFLTAMYIHILGRRPAASEVAAWLAVLPRVDRGGVAIGFLGSAEFRNQNIHDFYRTLLERPTPPTAAEALAWVNSGIDLTTMRVIFKSTPEYFLRRTGFLP